MKNSAATTDECHLESLEGPIEIGIATTPEEKKEIYRLRYRIYIEEMLQPLMFVDHSNKLLYDEMDEWSSLLYAKVGSKFIGTVRMNMGTLEDFPSELVKIYCMDRFQRFYEGQENQKFILNSKLMIAPSYRNSHATYLLLTKLYEFHCIHKVQFLLGDCNFHLLSFYEQLGIHRFGKNFVDAGYGLLVPFVILIDDIEHLRRVHSPFYRVVRKRERLNNQVAKWFYSEFPETAANNINSQLVTEDELWDYLSHCLERSPNKAIPALHELSEIEAKKFLHLCGVVVQCYAGDSIVTCGDSGNELNILLSGKIQFSGVNNILTGQHFGEIGLINRTKHTANIVVATDAKILVISFHSFQKFHRCYPEIATKVLHNLTDIHDEKGKDHIVS